MAVRVLLLQLLVLVVAVVLVVVVITVDVAGCRTGLLLELIIGLTGR
jgi:hypothetical protein